MPDSAPESNPMSTPTQAPGPDFSYEAEKPTVLWKWSALIAAIVFLYFGWQFGSALYFGLKLADGEVRHFHDELNSGQIEEICDDADGAFSQGPRCYQLVETLQGVHRKLGDVIDQRRGRINLNLNSQGVFITVEFFTEFASGQARETFTWHKGGNTLIFYSYNVQSKAFLR
jgi:hypothetical protein